MRFRSLLAAATIAASSVLPSAALATPNNSASSASLGRAVIETGVTFYTSCPDEITFAGAYSGSERAFIVCADGRRPYQYSQEEQDTLRHEAIHLAQDCMDGALGNGLETTSYIVTVMKLVADSGINAAQIEELYRRNGADDHVILLELEAWAGAAFFSNEEIEALLRKACRLPV